VFFTGRRSARTGKGKRAYGEEGARVRIVHSFTRRGHGKRTVLSEGGPLEKRGNRAPRKNLLSPDTREKKRKKRKKKIYLRERSPIKNGRRGIEAFNVIGKRSSGGERVSSTTSSVKKATMQKVPPPRKKGK